MSIPLLFGPYGSADLPKDVKKYGVNAVWFHEFHEPSFSDCSEIGLEACVEFKTFRADFQQHPELIPIGIDGQPIRYGKLVQGICLSQEEYLAETEERLLQGIRNYKPRGIWLDYMTYAGWFEDPDPDLQESCFCPACIEDFCHISGIDATDPKEIISKYGVEWKAHKCQKISGYAEYYAGLIKDKLPGCIVGAYMCPWTPEQFDGALTRIFAQDYQMMAESIDVFTPLIYCKKSGRNRGWGKEWLERSIEFVPYGCKVQLILDVLDYPENLIETASSQIPSWGIQMFAGAQIFQDSDKALLFKHSVEAIRKQIKIGRGYNGTRSGR